MVYLRHILMPVQSNVRKAIDDIRNGKIIIVTDSEDRENEGDFVMVAEDATPDKVNFMITHGRGLLCVPVTPEKAKLLNLQPMVENNQDVRRTAFTVSIDAKQNTTTGISAYDRSHTIRLIANEQATATDFIRPGHIFPLEARRGGVLVRAGHTEASLDLASLAGKKPVGVICEIMNKDGSMARMLNLKKIAKKYKLTIVTIKDLIKYLTNNQSQDMVEEVARSQLPTKYGLFSSIAFRSVLDNQTHIALIMGEIHKDEPTIVRVHSECMTGDVFASLRCDCGEQLHSALSIIAKHKSGVCLYMKQEGRGIGIANKLKAYNLQDQGMDTIEANKELGFPPDLREYGTGARILAKLGITKIKLMTNNPRKIIGLEGHNLHIVERIPLVISANKHNEFYLNTKARKLGHYLND